MKRLALFALIGMIAVSPAMAQSDNTTNQTELNFSEVELPEADQGIVEFEPDSPLRGLETFKDSVSVTVGLSSQADVAAERSAEALEEIQENNTDTGLEMMKGVEDRINNLPSEANENAQNAVAQAAKGIEQAQNNIEEKSDRKQTMEFTDFSSDDVSLENITVENGSVVLDNSTEGTLTLDIPPKEVISVEINHSNVEIGTDNNTNTTTAYTNSITAFVVDDREDTRKSTELGMVDDQSESPVKFTTENISDMKIKSGNKLNLELSKSDSNFTSPEVNSVTVKVKQFDIPSPVFQGIENIAERAKGVAQGQAPDQVEIPNPNVGETLDQVEEDMGKGLDEVGNEVEKGIKDAEEKAGKGGSIFAQGQGN